MTQVVSPEKGYVFHNRLTHSLKVGQIARRIAEKLNRDNPDFVNEVGCVDADAAETSGLAHDLGHPPFGHIAETELDQLVRAEGVTDGYEGNAQSLRILTTLAFGDARDTNGEAIGGLNLTRTTLNGVMKYPWSYGQNAAYPKKWGFYSQEAKVFEWLRPATSERTRSLIAEVMDWADDVTFAIHDLLDFFAAGRIPIERCKGEHSDERERLLRAIFEKRKPEWKPRRAEYLDALEAILESFPFFPHQRYTDSPEHRLRIVNFSTLLIRQYVSAFKLVREGQHNTADVQLYESSSFRRRIDPSAYRQVEVLKQFIWEYVIENPELALVQQGQRAAVRLTFERLMQAADDDHLFLFPQVFQYLISDKQHRNERVRTVADCVAGMTEKEILYFASSLGSWRKTTIRIPTSKPGADPG